MITFSDAEISKKIVANAKELIILIGNDEYLENILKDNQKIVNSYNLQNIDVIDLTATEIGRFKATIKKVAVGYYGTHDINLKIDIDNSLLYSYTIFHRKLKAKKTWRRTALEYATTNIFKTEIINQLTKINT